MKFNPETTVILVTDVQNDYVHLNWKCSKAFGWNVSNLDKIAQETWQTIDRVKGDFDVVLLQNEEAVGTYPSNMPMIDESDELCVKWTWWHDFHPAINTEWCTVIQKNHPSWFYRKRWGPISELEQYLLDKEKEDILHAGVLLWRCVNATIIWASIAGFRNTWLIDLMWNPLGEKMQTEESITRDLFKSHYLMDMIDSSEIEVGN
jgi:nicotinamidase-related amidase